MPGFKYLKNRIHAFVLTLLTVILVLVLLLVNRANNENAGQQVLQDIKANGKVLLSAVEEVSTHLGVAARLLSSDYAFKQAYATHDHATILSAMRNHLDRLEQADVMIIMDIDDGSVIADTRNDNLVEAEPPLSAILLSAEEDDYLEAVGYKVVDGVLYQFVVVPLLVPDPEAWIAIGFRIDNDYLQRFKALSSSDVSIYSETENKRDLLASTLDVESQRSLAAWLTTNITSSDTTVIDLQGEEFLTNIRPFDKSPNFSVILQRSLDDALHPYQRLQFSLVLFFMGAMVVAYFGSSSLAQKIASPVRVLAALTQRVAKGDYSLEAEVTTRDEIGELAASFNHMTKGLEEKDRVRGLLGKVVSPEIAKQLIDKGVELGGEEKQVTVLFSDLRNFTSLCEGHSASEILEMLNLYLNEMSHAVESNSGVVDKYIGDAMMALYGAPLASTDDAANAVHTALQMQDLLVHVNEQFKSRGIPEIDIGIGINTDVVVAGNMGSASRLNYTVIGDGVNLASRLEGLTKFYGVKILVAESTAKLADEISYREIDRVRVKGKSEPVVIYEPYRPELELEIHAGHEQYGLALQTYQEGDWGRARVMFAELYERYPEQKLYDVYLQRCNHLLHEPPSGEWDGVYTYTSK